jgi:hypothetical protein
VCGIDILPLGFLFEKRKETWLKNVQVFLLLSSFFLPIQTPQMLGPFGRGDVVVLLLSRCVRVRVGERETDLVSLFVRKRGGGS